MNRKILQLAIPNILSDITIPLLGMVDIALMGNLGSKQQLGAVAIGTMIFNFIYWGFSFLRMGTSGFTAQAFGERNFKESILIFSRGMLVCIIASFLLIALQKPISVFSFYLIHGSAEVETFASSYFSIRIWSSPATIGLYVLYGWLIGMQNAKLTMIIAVSVNVLNILLNWVLVYWLNMGIEGVAYGNLIAQYIGFSFAIWLFYKYYGKLLKHFNIKSVLDLKALKHFFSINSDIFIRTLCLIFAFTYFTARSASVNDTILAANTILLQFLTLFSYFIDGFAFAAEALVGKFIGARNTKSLYLVIKKLFVWGFVISLLFTALYFFAGNYILQLISKDTATILLANQFLGWVVLIPIVSFAAFLWDGIYIGATASKAMRNSMIIVVFLIYFPAILIFYPILGNHAIWLGMILFMLGRSLFLTFLSKHQIFTIKY